ncbi:MAG: endonuclease MutS2 [Bacteroidota bacterium]
MKYYHPRTYEKLGFDVILQTVAGTLMTEEAKERCLNFQPYSDPEKLLTSLRRTEEFRELLIYDDPLPIKQFHSMAYLLKKLEVKGTWLTADELGRFLGWAQTLLGLRKYLQQREDKYPELQLLINRNSFSAYLIKDIEAIIDEKGNVRDSASPLLNQVRRNIYTSGNELRSVLNKVLKRAAEKNWSPGGEITIRNDRLVIPVKADAKGRVPGFVQDISQSGNTLFLEPAESLALNNKLKELKLQEQNEVIRILTDVTEQLRQHKEEIASFHKIMVELDFVRGKAKLAVKLKAVLPKVEVYGTSMELKEAYYPLLVLRSEEETFEVVPLSVQLTQKERIILISGPNAGGKSVSLKTVGLLQLMLQSGFLVPVREDSVFRIFDTLFIDLGDEQSVENDLSTYTSHLFQMRQMGDNMNHNSLFLIDEFGSGTDPKQGGSIAESFLERFVIQRAYGIITTHYGNLKNYAANTKGIANAAMQFDKKDLKPTYKLIVGVPGRSYALDIAKRVGVHYSILKKARKKIGEETIQSEELIDELESRQSRLNTLLEKSRSKEKELNKLLKETQAEKDELKQQKKQILNEAKRDARKLIKDANRRIEQTIREIRENQAEKQQTQKLREELKESMPVPIPEAKPKEEVVPEGIQIVGGEISQGDWVKLADGKTVGQLIEVKGKRGVVESGSMRLQTKLSQLVKIKIPEKKGNGSVRSNNYSLSTVNARMELDLMGKRVEEALPMLEKMVDDARLAGLKTINILHGKGTGVLREAVRKYLNDLSFVKRVYDAPMEMGGDGWTICEFKN